MRKRRPSARCEWYEQQYNATPHHQMPQTKTIHKQIAEQIDCSLLDKILTSMYSLPKSRHPSPSRPKDKKQKRETPGCVYSGFEPRTGVDPV